MAVGCRSSGLVCRFLLLVESTTDLHLQSIYSLTILLFRLIHFPKAFHLSITTPIRPLLKLAMPSDNSNKAVASSNTC